MEKPWDGNELGMDGTIMYLLHFRYWGKCRRFLKIFLNKNNGTGLDMDGTKIYLLQFRYYRKCRRLIGLTLILNGGSFYDPPIK